MNMKEVGQDRNVEGKRETLTRAALKMPPSELPEGRKSSVWLTKEATYSDESTASHTVMVTLIQQETDAAWRNF